MLASLVGEELRARALLRAPLDTHDEFLRDRPGADSVAPVCFGEADRCEELLPLGDGDTKPARKVVASGSQGL